MHALSHTIVHRGPGASRTRTRWQPYSSTLAVSSTPSRSPANYLNTPASSVSSSPPSSVSLNQPCNLERPRKLSISPSCAIIGQSREAQKNRYVTRLVDQTVNSLCEIWHPDDIPAVFRTSSRTAFSGPTASDVSQSEPLPLVQTQYFQHSRNIQLPSPVSPSSQPSPFCPVIPPAKPSGRSSQLLPLKGFVHEVLRRSRTSTGVLQTALCYLEAVRGKVPELLRQEQSKTTDKCQEQLEQRITVVTNLDIETDRLTASNHLMQAYDVEFARLVGLQEPLTAPPSCSASSMSTPSSSVTSTSKRPSPPLPPLPPLPSPLLCPRRTFLACLILASKFIQDRSYSNRAWAKLAGLAPREISRCERALGEALEWRLWVGKSASTVNGSSRKPVARSRSESDISFGATMEVPSISVSDATRLRRSATAPSVSAMDVEVPSYDSHFLGSMLPQVVVEEPEDYSSASSLALGASSSSSRLVAGDATELFKDQDELSPPVLTPTLSYSPMSCTSSSSSDDGERTIQMSGFLDLPTPFTGPASFVRYQCDYAGTAQGRSKIGTTLLMGFNGFASSNIMVVEPSQMAPIVDPAMTPHGPVSLPPLSEALGSFGPMYVHGLSGYGIPQSHSSAYGSWAGIQHVN